MLALLTKQQVESLKTLTRNETSSTLGNRIIGDEREEVVVANSTQTLLTRFVTNGNSVRDLAAFKKNYNLTTYRPQTTNDDTSWSFTHFKVSDSSQEVNYMSERVVDNYKFKLHKACFKGDVEQVKSILNNSDSDLNLNLKNKLGLTALDCAIEGRRREVVKLLLNDPR